MLVLDSASDVGARGHRCVRVSMRDKLRIARSEQALVGLVFGLPKIAYATQHYFRLVDMALDCIL